MNSKEYISKSARTDLDEYGYETKAGYILEGNIADIHAALGIAGESGEIVEIIKKDLMYEKTVDRNKLIEEIGDLFWYIAILAREYNFTFEDCMKANIEKLAKRYPEKFTPELARERKDES